VRSARWPLRALFRGCINVPPCGYSGSLCGRAPGGKGSHLWDCYESTKFLPACPEHDRVPLRTGRLVPTQQRRESVAVRDRLTGRRANRLSGHARPERRLGGRTTGAAFSTSAAVVYAPFSLRAILRLRAWHVLIPLLVGTALAALSLEARSYPGLLVACAVIGLGQGPGYTLGLATVTHGRPPHLQGKATSRYAAAAYGVCAAAVVAIGAAASAWGLVGALFATAAVFAMVGAIAVAAAGRPQNWASVAV
jgi:hypothetical protein